jgi:hypothetical protein
MEFNHIRLSGDPQPQRSQRHAIFYPHITAWCLTAGINPLMHDSALGRINVLYPGLLDVDQRALPSAEKQVLQG